MKRVFIILLGCCIFGCLYGQEPQPVEKSQKLLSEEMENVRVHQDEAITRMMREKVFGEKREVEEIQGYRVQIYSSNRQQTAKTEATLLEKSLSGTVDVNIYVSYTPPFWKVRLGDFRTQEEAMAFKNKFIQSHPELVGETYIVRDQIQVVKE